MAWRIRLIEKHKLNGWVRLGLVASMAWVALTTLAYVTEIANHPAFLGNQVPALHGYFHWVDDADYTAKAHAEATSHGRDFRGVFLKPTFSLWGYMALAFWPVVIGWLGTYAIVLAFRWIREGFQT